MRGLSWILKISLVGLTAALSACNNPLSGANLSTVDSLHQPGLPSPTPTSTSASATAIDSISFTTPPPGAVAADASNLVEVTLYDAGANPMVSDSSSVVTLSAYASADCSGAAVGGSLSSTAATAAAGVASFATLGLRDVSVRSVGAAVSSTLGTKTACAGNLTVTPGALAALAWGTAPASAHSAHATTPMTSFTARLLDAYGNLRTGDSATAVTLTRTTGSGALGGTLTRTAVAGIATFNDVTYTKAETLGVTATAGAVSVASGAIAVGPGAYDPAESVVTVSAGTVVSGASITATLTAKDAYGNANPTGLPAVGSIAFTSSLVGGTGNFGAIAAQGAGVYTASFTGDLAGAVTLGATISAVAVGHDVSVTVNPGTTIASVAWEKDPARMSVLVTILPFCAEEWRAFQARIRSRQEQIDTALQAEPKT